MRLRTCGSTGRQLGLHCPGWQRPLRPLAHTLLVEGSMLTPTAAAARSSGSNWRGGGVGCRRSSAQAGKWRSVNSATAGWGGAKGGRVTSAVDGRRRRWPLLKSQVLAELCVLPGPLTPSTPATHPPNPPVQLARSIISSTIWLASLTCGGWVGCRHGASHAAAVAAAKARARHGLPGGRRSTLASLTTHHLPLCTRLVHAIPSFSGTRKPPPPPPPPLQLPAVHPTQACTALLCTHLVHAHIQRVVRLGVNLKLDLGGGQLQRGAVWLSDGEGQVVR